MSYGFNFGNRGNYRCSNNQNFVSHLYNYIGETVTIFTTSGGASGCGFTGLLLSINCDYCRLSTQIGPPPANPLSNVICPDPCGYGGGPGGPGSGPGVEGCNCGPDRGYDRNRGIGSVVDIPLCRISAFCHNAV